MTLFIRNICFLFLLQSISNGLFGQNIAWERYFRAKNFNGIVQGAVEDEASNIYFIPTYTAYNILDTLPLELFKLDSSGNLLSRKIIYQDTSQYVFAQGIAKIPEENNFYIWGQHKTDYSFGSHDFDFIIKIDTSGNVLWEFDTSYVNFIWYFTNAGATVLKDKSIVTVGYSGFAVTEYDVVVRRIDSLGNLMFEKNIPLAGWQFGNSIIEMMDGSLMISGKEGDAGLIIRIGFDGRYIDHISLQPNLGDFRLSSMACLMNKKLGYSLTSYDNNLEETYGEFYIFNDSLQNTFHTGGERGIWFGPLILQDSSHLFNMMNYQFDLQVRNRILPYFSYDWQVTFGHFPDSVKYSPFAEVFGDDLILTGGFDTISGAGNTRYYLWVAKIANVGQKWNPNPCELSPPIADFNSSYDYPILTLTDMSYSGLKYLDTIYSWEWSISNGQNGTHDSILVFFDTAISKNIDIQLLVTNWYGCIDTVFRTLNFTPSGIEDELNFDVSVYPNPSTVSINVEIFETIENRYTFRIIDINGKSVKKFILETQNTTLDISTLYSGVYFYEVISESSIQRGKFIKH